ncbi:hypothetical protein [Phytoactinopolyspora endophytica]|uniref:hypothetical protein n=1 Tax=Phytoactinopolyspora endophytica TaxID=1642495 RepID=UPI00101DD128|nr:hypothetical protein [Phytoactinopolyspora endophytica]
MKTGDLGEPNKKGASSCFGLGCLAVSVDDWHVTFDELRRFRQRICTSYNVPVDTEIKASSLIRGAGDLRAIRLAPAQRQLVFRAHMRILSNLNVHAFTVVVDKERTDSSGIMCLLVA